MNWHKGNIAEAVAESKAKDAVFVVFIEGKDELSLKLERFVDDVRVRSRLETADFVAIKVQGNSSAYGQFMSLYKVVPIPSLFFIGKTGTPLDIATGITDSVEELTAKIDKVLVLAGKRSETPSVASFVEQQNQTEVRSFAGADDSASLSNDEAPGEAPGEAEPNQTVSEEPQSPSSVPVEEADFAPVTDSASLQVEESKVDPPSAPSAPAVASFASISGESSTSSVGEAAVSPTALAAEKRAAEAAAARKVETATTSVGAARDLAASTILPAVSLLTPAVPVATAAQGQEQVQVQATSSEARMAEVQSLLEQKRRERLEEEKQREKENEIRRRREGRQAQNQQALAKEQELKNMQERIRRERQEEQAARERIRAQIAADRAEQAHRVQIASDATSTSPSVAGAASVDITTESSVSSVNETRLQIRLPGGINHTKSFPVGEVLGTVRIYVRNELLAASDVRDFTLAASYPRREFHTEDEVKTLSELKLVPNAVVLVLTKEHVNRVVRSGGSLMTMLVTVIWAMITPAAKAFDYINKMGLRPLTQKLTALMANFRGTAGRPVDIGIVQGDAAARRNMDMFSLRPTPAPGYNYEEPENIDAVPEASTSTPQQQPGLGSTPQPHPTSSQAASQPSSSSSSQQFQQRPGGYQPPKYGDSNIRRLRDTKKDDNEKDKATYNGNSTQQQ